MDQLITVDENGKVLSLYDDNLPNLGKRKITRASNVEPDEDGNWIVRFSRNEHSGRYSSRYMALSTFGFTATVHRSKAFRFGRRESALEAERLFIQTIILGGKDNG